MAQQAVGVFVAAALPRAAGIAEVDLYLGREGKGFVSRHFLAAIPGEGTPQFGWQPADVPGERGNHSGGIVARHLEKHHKARGALDQCHHVRVVCATKQVAFPVPRHGPILRFGGTLPDGDPIDNLPQTASGDTSLGLPQLPFGPQMRHQLFLRDATRLNEQAAIDCFVRELTAY